MRGDAQASKTCESTQHCPTKRIGRVALFYDCTVGIRPHSPSVGISRCRPSLKRICQSCDGRRVAKPCGTNTTSRTPSPRQSRCSGRCGPPITKSTRVLPRRCVASAPMFSSRPSRPLRFGQGRPSGRQPVRPSALQLPRAAKSSTAAASWSAPLRFESGMPFCNTGRFCCPARNPAR